MADLSEAFRKARDQSEDVVTFKGMPLTRIYQRRVGIDHRVTIRFVSHTSDRAEGLRITSVGGLLDVNGQTLEDIVLWADTITNEVVLRPTQDAMTLKFWNVWRYDNVMHAWIGNAAMRVIDEGRRVRLLCSDGVGEPDFSDLVVELTCARND